MMRIEESIALLAEDIWLAVLGLPLMPSEAGLAEPAAEDSLTGSVSIRGAWQGVVRIQCSTAFAQRAASVMFGLEPLHIGAEEERDALGELANMVSGNLKAILPGPSRLCIPVVAAGRTELEPDAEFSRVCLDCEEHPIVLSVVTTRPGASEELEAPE